MTRDLEKPISEEIQDAGNLSSEDIEASFAWPTLVAVVVTHNPGDWLEECLASLALQDYPDLTTLVVDAFSDEDPSARVAKAMPSAYVRRCEKEMNFAEAVNMAVNSIEGATYVLICHDDVIIKPGAIAAMVEEAFRSNASIVGPKIIDAAVKDKLLEVGGMIDRFGVPFSGIEPDEVDQGQHDGVRDVFFVSSATMLVRADLFRAIGGFDVECFPGAEDIDIAWRAHLVGARVLVQPDAVVSHHKASDRQRKSRTSATAIVARHRMRAVLKNSSAVSLAWILPMAFILHTVEGIVWLLRANPKRAWLLFSGWMWNIRHFGDTRKERSKIQKTREVSDRVLSSHQIGGSARIRRFFASIIQNRQLNKITSASKTFAQQSYSKRTRETPIYLSAIVVYLLAIRSLIFDGIAGVGEFVAWPSFKDQISSIFHGGLPVSEESMLSSTFGRIVALTLTFISGMNSGLAQTLFTASLIPVGAIGIRLLLKERAMGPRSISISAITYATFVLGMFTFSQGNLGSIILLAGLPHFIRALSNRKPRQAGFSAGLMIAFYPTAIVVCIVISTVFILIGDQYKSDLKATSSISDLSKRIRTVLICALIAMVLNAGMIVDALRGIDRNIIGLTDTNLNFQSYLFVNLQMTIALYAAIAVCVFGLFFARNERTSEIRLLCVSASILASIAIVSVHLAQPVFEAGALFVVIQLAAAISVGICVHSFADEMKLRSFGASHLATSIAIIAVFVSVLVSVPVLREGTFGLPSRSWSDQIDAENNNRVIYLGDPKLLPGRSVLAPLNRSFTIAPSPKASLSSSFTGPASPLDQEARKIYSAMMSGETSHSGYLFARLGIGTIVVPTSRAPESATVPRDQQLLDALDRQIDLVRLGDREGLIVYKNASFEKGYPQTSYVKSISPAKVLESRSLESNPKLKIEEAPISKWAILMASITSASIVLLLLWPRRHQLISSQSLKISQIVSSSKKQSVEKENFKTIDLEIEHSIDESNADSGETKNDELISEDAK